MSLVTRSIASESSSKGSVRRRAEIAKLKARQAVERARVKADIAKRQAEAEAQECIDVAELLELEASLEENGNDGKSSKTDLVDSSMAQQRTRQWVDETSRSANDGMNDERCRHEGRPSASVSRPRDKVVQSARYSARADRWRC